MPLKKIRYLLKTKGGLRQVSSYHQSKGYCPVLRSCNKAVANLFPHTAEPSSATRTGQCLLDCKHSVTEWAAARVRFILRGDSPADDGAAFIDLYAPKSNI